jgi:hypothetical protein
MVLFFLASNTGRIGGDIFGRGKIIGKVGNGQRETVFGGHGGEVGGKQGKVLNKSG